VVTVTSHLVSFPLNKSLSSKRALLVCYLILAVFDVAAIDSMEFTIGQVMFDTQSAADIHAELQFNSDTSVGFVLNGNFLQENIELEGQLRDEHWQVSTVIKTTAPELINNYQLLSGDTAKWQVDGNAEIALSASGTTTDFSQQQIQYQLVFNDLNGELPEVATAFEGLDISVSGRAEYGQSGLHGDAAVQFNSGLLAFNDLLLEPVAGTIHIKTDFAVDDHRVRLTDFSLDDPGGLRVRVPVFRADPVNYMDQHEIVVNVEAARFPHVYKAWAQPVLYDTVLEDIETEGSFSASISINNREIKRLSVDLNSISLSDNAGRFSIYELSSHLHASNGFDDGQLSLSWQGAELYRLLLGASELGFDISKKNLAVTSPFSIPLYDGALKVFKLSVEDLQADHPAVIFDGILTPVSLSSLSSAMGWPTLDGSMSGVIPSVRYDDSGLTVDGILLARAFDGTFKIQHLRMSDLLSPLPRLSADFRLQQLDLEKLTRAFDFGRIEGKLSGHIAGLKMVAWKANAFDAFFYTPEDDDSRHIISQRAVDNLTSLSGSDIGSVLSRSYLRFFENFRYDRLGVSCILRNNTCRMNGIESAAGSGYYIVKGGLLPPRLDIIGYSHAVDWPDLLSRMERVMSDNAPVIQ